MANEKKERVRLEETANFCYRNVCIATQANIPWFWKGNPGLGKTSILEALAQELNVPLHIEIGAISDPIDINGALFPDPEGYVVRKAMKWVEEFAGSDGIIVYDELPHSPPAIQAAMLRVICESKVGEVDLGPNVKRGAIGNPTEVAGGYDMNPALANRFCHIDWDSRGYAEYWMDGMMNGFRLDIPILPKGWDDRLRYWQTNVAIFAGKYKKTVLSALPEQEEHRVGPWPSPRTWTMGARLLSAAESFGEDVQISLLSGLVGAGAAGEFYSWFKSLDLPDPEALLKNAELFPTLKPGKEHVAYAIVTNVLAHIQNRPDATEAKRNSDWVNAWKVLYQAAKQNPGLSFGFVQTMIDLRPSFKVQAPKEARDLIVQYGRDIDILPNISLTK